MKTIALIVFLMPLATLLLAQTKEIKKTIVVANNTLSLSNESVNDETCYFGGGDGSIDIGISGGLPPYTISWENSIGSVVATSEDISNLVADTYEVTVTDANNCVVTNSFTVPYYCPYTTCGSVNIVNVLNSNCGVLGGSIELEVNTPEPFGYTLSKYDALTSSYTTIETGSRAGVSTITFTNLANGQYDFFVTEPTTDCNYSVSIFVGSDDFYLYDGLNPANNTNCVAPNGELSLNIIDPTLPNNYEVIVKNLYTGIETTTNETSTSVNITGLVSAAYAVQVKDLDNPTCVLQETTFISNYMAYLSVTEDSKTGQQNCANPDGSVSVSVSGGSGSYGYQWYGPVAKATEDISQLLAGTYYLYVNDLISGCQQDPSLQGFIVPDNRVYPTVAHNVANNSNCSAPFNGGISLNISGTTGPHDTFWYDANNLQIATTSSLVAQPPGNYGYTVTHQSTGCSKIVFASYPGAPAVLDSSLPAVSIGEIVVDENSCTVPNGSIDITVSASTNPYTVSWIGPSSFTATTEDVTGLQSGQYELTISVNCTVVVNNPPVIENTSFVVAAENSNQLVLTISDPDGNLDLSTLEIVEPPTSGAMATIDTDYNLVVDYSNKLDFLGSDQLRISVCDLAGACTESDIFIDVEGELIVYNAISPNGDNKNDYLRIRFIQPGSQVEIFNRWGDRVYTANNYDNLDTRFEGKSDNGKELPTGTYFYKIRLGTSNKILTGYLSLKR
jgi:gliding motility-associated-like protein